MKFFIVVLKGCPYSENALSILKKVCRKNNHTLEYELISQEKKDAYKKKYKSETFPIIFYTKNKRRVRIGGHDNLISFIEKHNLKN